ncbi:MAG: dihydroorotate dehydrogenase [Coriobacteriales bacterium]
MSKVNMAVDLGGIPMKNPVNTASGTFGFGKQFENMMDVSALGAVTGKGCSAQPWPGNPQPRMHEVTSGMLNSVGLMNPGVRGMVEKYGDYLEALSGKTSVICQVAGHSVQEYVDALALYDELTPWAAGFELNISCPNVSKGGAAMGSTPEGASEVVRECRQVTNRPLVVKLAPTRVPEIASAVQEAGADAISLINTIPAMAIDVDTRRSYLSRPTAGLSGPAIHPIAVRMAWEACNAVTIPVCGIGGIMTGRDAAEFILVGCTAVSVGMASMVEPAASIRVLRELEQWAQSQGVSDISELRGAFLC